MAYSSATNDINELEFGKFEQTSSGPAIRTTATITGDVNVESTSVNVNAYVGKPLGSNGDFITTRTANTTFTCTSLPTGVTAINTEDIELIRQITAAGVVTATYSRDDATITCSGTSTTTVTVTGAVFAATDTITLYTNIYRPLEVENFVGNPIRKTSSQSLATGALAYTTNFAAVTRIIAVLINFSGSVSQTVNITLDSGAGTNYDTLLGTRIITAGTECYWYPPEEFKMLATDELLISCTNAGTPAVTAYVSVIGETN